MTQDDDDYPSDFLLDETDEHGTMSGDTTDADDDSNVATGALESDDDADYDPRNSDADDNDIGAASAEDHESDHQETASQEYAGLDCHDQPWCDSDRAKRARGHSR